MVVCAAVVSSAVVWLLPDEFHTWMYGIVGLTGGARDVLVLGVPVAVSVLLFGLKQRAIRRDVSSL